MTDYFVQGEHSRSLFEKQLAQTNFYKACLYDAWKALRGQSKGMKRMARKIKHLKAQLAAAETKGQTMLVRGEPIPIAELLGRFNAAAEANKEGKA